MACTNWEDTDHPVQLGPKVIKLFSCLAQLSMEFIISIKISRNSAFIFQA